MILNNDSFTFQYGSINTENWVFQTQVFVNFTFQYGSINTNFVPGSRDVLRFFTFQYGSINTKPPLQIPHMALHLYIPIWFY